MKRQKFKLQNLEKRSSRPWETERLPRRSSLAGSLFSPRNDSATKLISIFVMYCAAIYIHPKRSIDLEVFARIDLHQPDVKRMRNSPLVNVLRIVMRSNLLQESIMTDPKQKIKGSKVENLALTTETKKFLMETANQLKGSTRRAFIAKTSNYYSDLSLKVLTFRMNQKIIAKAGKFP